MTRPNIATSSFSTEVDPYYEERLDLAAIFRMTARLDMHESIANHFSFAVVEDGSQFLMNPKGRHFSNIKASELLLLDAHDQATMNRANAPDLTAWELHGALHRNVSHARCILHLHPRYTTVLASIEVKDLPPIDQNSMRFYQRISLDTDFAGLSLDDEADRLTKAVGDNKILLMGNHGVIVLGDSIAQAFDDLYYFERACSNYITALMTGKPLRTVSHEVAEKTAEQWENYPQFAAMHLREIREILDREEPDYRD